MYYYIIYIIYMYVILLLIMQFNFFFINVKKILTEIREKNNVIFYTFFFNDNLSRHMWIFIHQEVAMCMTCHKHAMRTRIIN